MHFTPGHDHFHDAPEEGGLDARPKLIAFLGIAIAAASLPRGQWVHLGALALLLAALIVALRVPPRGLFKRMLVALPFVLFIAALLPFRPVDWARGDRAVPPFGLSEHGVLMFLDVLGKAAVSIGCVAALGAVEPVPGIMRGMQRMRFPAVFVSLVAFTHRYVVVLVDEARRMKRARDARAFGARWLWQARTIGHMIGNLFLRSVERAERVYFAMASRGYEGGALKVAPKALSGAEWMMIAASVVVIVAVRFLLP